MRMLKGTIEALQRPGRVVLRVKTQTGETFGLELSDEAFANLQVKKAVSPPPPEPVVAPVVVDLEPVIVAPEATVQESPEPAASGEAHLEPSLDDELAEQE